MKLHQIKIDYNAEHDRLMMLVATSEGAEIRLWMTRRYVKLLWPLLIKLAEEMSPRVQTQADPQAKKALLGFEYEQAVKKADFSTPFQESARSMPLGNEPLLLARIQTGRDPAGLPLLAMHPTTGQGINLTLNPVLLHSVCKLIVAASSKSDWDIQFKLPGVQLENAEEDVPRVLN
ncbi:MAG: hypothetical protein IPK29_07150 [Betaproteobacteria bacterium]|jgi:hypothetical protein|nr:hypothetical protein [Betaproteobacteria bacterium]